MTNEKNIHDDPVSLDLKPRPKGIVKVNRLPILLFVGLFLSVLVFLIFNMSRKQSDSRKKAENNLEESKVVSSNQPVSKDIWFEDSTYDNIRVNQISNSQVIAEIDSLKQTSVESPQKTVMEDVATVSLSQKVPLDSEKSFNDAVKSPGIIEGSGYDSGAGNSNSNQPVSPYIRESSPNLGYPVVPVKSDLDDRERFLKEGVLPGEYLPHVLKDVISPYEIKAGTLIPVALEGGLNSDLPGYLRARVRENVYDTVSGQYLLIPQGSLVLGEYQSKVDYGQNRVLVVWTRLIYPNGKSLNLEKMSGVDRSGYSGLKDKTNNHWFRLYSSALLMSVIGSGYEFLKNDEQKNEDSSDTVATQVGQQIGQVSNEVIRKGLDVSPTIEISPGHKFNVFVQKDIVLQPWEGYEPL